MNKDVKTVVITGSSRGFGFCQAKKFKELGFNVVLSATNESNLLKALEELNTINPDETNAVSVVCDVTRREDLENLWKEAIGSFGRVDIWVNNAGVNSPDKPVCELTEKEISTLLDIDLKGVVYGSVVAFNGMKEQGFGQIYNVEGYGSNDAMMTGLTMYGTPKEPLPILQEVLQRKAMNLRRIKSRYVA